MAQNKTVKDIWKRDLLTFKNEVKNFDVKDYAKSVYANKFLLVGIASYVASLSLSTFLLENSGGQISPPTELMIYFAYGTGLLLVGATTPGKTTYDTYRKAKKIIARNKKIPKKTIDICLNTYCNTVGLNMARKEAGLEPLVMTHMLN